MKKPLKVALVMPTHFNIHSSLNNFIKTYEHLIKRKEIQVTLFTDSKNKLSLKNFKVKKIRGFDYGTILEKMLFLLGIPRYYYPKLERELKGYDVITANNPEFYLYAYQAYRAAKKYNCRFVLRTSQTVEGFFLYKLTKYFVNPIVKKAYGFAAATIFTNPQAEERCLKLGLIKNSKKSMVTGHATDIRVFQPKKVKKRGRKILLSVGGLYKLKGHHLIIQALKKLIDKGNDVELWIVGEGYYKKNLESLSRELGIQNRVKLLGNKGHAELANLYNRADVFVLANFQEITPAVNEALACETPVVVMECGGRKFVIPSEEYGLVSRKFDIVDLAGKIEQVIKNSQLASKLAKKGRKRVCEQFSVEKVAEKLLLSFTKGKQ